MSYSGLGDLHKMMEKEQKEKREFLKNHAILSVTCSCGFEWKPYGDKFSILPFVEDLTCPKCKQKGRYQALDEETKKKMALRKLGLDNNDLILSKVRHLEKQHEIDEKEKKVLRERMNLIEAKMNLLMKWASKRERDFRDIEAIAEEEREKNEFRKSNR